MTMDVMSYLHERGILCDSVQGKYGRDGIADELAVDCKALEHRLKNLDQRIEILGQLITRVQPVAIGRLQVRWVTMHGELRPRLTILCRAKSTGKWYQTYIPDSNIHRYLKKTNEFKINYELMRNAVSLLAYLLKVRSEHLLMLANLSRALKGKVRFNPFDVVDGALDAMVREAASAAKPRNYWS